MNEHDEIIASFVNEATEALADMENDLLAVEAQCENLDPNLINKVFRIVHSLKGTAGFCGLRSIGDLAHEVENVLNLVRAGELVATRDVVDPVLRAADCLSTMVADVSTSNDVDVSGHVRALSAVITADAPPETVASMKRNVDVALPNGTLAFLMISENELVSRQKRGDSIHAIEVDFIAHVQGRDRTPVDFLQILLKNGELINSYLSTAGMPSLDEPSPHELLFMVLLASSKSVEELADGLELPADRVHLIATPEQICWTEAGPVVPEDGGPPPPAAAEVAPEAAAGSAAARPSAPVPTTLRVNVGVLDTLMNLAGELVLSRNQLLQAIASGETSEQESVVARIDRVTSDLQDAIMQTRMQPVGTVFNKFPRIVRDMTAALGKECNLLIEGRDVELDKSIIEAIGDPLTHLVRNSVDHGLEQPAERTAAGKAPAGKIELCAYHGAGKVNIAIKDDGRGIDADKIKASAVAKGVISQIESSELSDREAVRLIFHPGFSTAAEVTEYSGRGVGMDVVKTNIEKLGGTIDIDTEIGKGSSITIQLPLTLAIIPSLVVRSAHGRFAIPQANIGELIRVKAEDVAKRVERLQGAEVIRLRGVLLPLVRLSTAMKDDVACQAEEAARAFAAKEGSREIDQPPAPRADTTDAPRPLSIVVLESGVLRYGLVVDDLEDSQEIVVKPLGRHLGSCPYLAGGAILGDGSVALVLDVAGLASQCNLRMIAEESSDRTSPMNA